MSASGLGTGSTPSCPASICCAPGTCATPSPATPTRGSSSVRCARGDRGRGHARRDRTGPPRHRRHDQPRGAARRPRRRPRGLDVRDPLSLDTAGRRHRRRDHHAARHRRIRRDHRRGPGHRAAHPGSAPCGRAGQRSGRRQRVPHRRRPAAAPPRPLPARPKAAGRRAPAPRPRARSLLVERLAAPPSLEQLASELGTSPFALLRAFKAEYGLPPHAWLTGERVRRARLPPGRRNATGRGGRRPWASPTSRTSTATSPGSSASPPGAYRRERARTYKDTTAPPVF